MFGNITGYISHSHINHGFSNQILLIHSLFDIRCTMITFGKQVIVFKKGTFAPPAPGPILRRFSAATLCYDEA